MKRKQRKKTEKSNQQEVGQIIEPKSLPIFEAIVTTANQYVMAFSCLMADLAANRIAPSVGNAISNAGGKMLKAFEMNARFGASTKPDGVKELRLIE